MWDLQSVETPDRLKGEQGEKPRREHHHQEHS